MCLDLDALIDDLKSGRLAQDREATAQVFFALGELMEGATGEQKKDMAAARRLWRERSDNLEKNQLQEKYFELIGGGAVLPDVAAGGVNRVIFAILHNNCGITPEFLSDFVEFGSLVGVSDENIDEIIVKNVPGASKFQIDK